MLDQGEEGGNRAKGSWSSVHLCPFWPCLLSFFFHVLESLRLLFKLKNLQKKWSDDQQLVLRSHLTSICAPMQGLPTGKSGCPKKCAMWPGSEEEGLKMFSASLLGSMSFPCAICMTVCFFSLFVTTSFIYVRPSTRCNFFFSLQ